MNNYLFFYTLINYFKRGEEINYSQCYSAYKPFRPHIVR